MILVIPPMRNRKEQRDYDKHLYKLRHLIENAFLKLKRFRGVATRYVKTTSAFRGAVYWLLFLFGLSLCRHYLNQLVGIFKKNRINCRYD